MAPRSRLSTAVVAIQALLGARVFLRFLRTAGGGRIAALAALPAGGDRLAVIVPVLDEVDRLAPCLDGLLAQGPEVAEILVLDGGSADGTRDLVRRYIARDRRVRLVDAGPVPPQWNGKAWGLQAGLLGMCRDVPWVLMVDADVRPAPLLARSLLAHAQRTGLAALSVATRQELAGLGDALLHPALLTTLVYRFGLPGHSSRSLSRVQANGQCFLARRDVLVHTGAVAVARTSRCEDVTMARCLARAGWAVGFYEGDDLVRVQMYAGWRDTMRNWPRSLPLLDQYRRSGAVAGLVEVTLVQALPLPMTVVLAARGPRWMLLTNLVLTLARLGVLAGTARAYRRPPWSYWLSPLCDLPATLLIWRSLLRRRHTWRGRVLVSGGA